MESFCYRGVSSEALARFSVAEAVHDPFMVPSQTTSDV